jgi:hypothetical protein
MNLFLFQSTGRCCLCFNHQILGHGPATGAKPTRASTRSPPSAGQQSVCLAGWLCQLDVVQTQVLPQVPNQLGKAPGADQVAGPRVPSTLQSAFSPIPHPILPKKTPFFSTLALFHSSPRRDHCNGFGASLCVARLAWAAWAVTGLGAAAVPGAVVADAGKWCTSWHRCREVVSEFRFRNHLLSVEAS